MSPELTLRPSLSGRGYSGRSTGGASVAGANAPAFVERIQSAQHLSWPFSVSPELTLRPSLSGRPGAAVGSRRNVSPELTLRPSLSVSGPVVQVQLDPRVAGANAPAFVERTARNSARTSRRRRVAGANAPAFVERHTWAPAPCHPQGGVAGANAPAFVERRERRLNCRRRRVSPELTLRPSLSAG